jgi:hypothetical protein
MMPERSDNPQPHATMNTTLAPTIEAAAAAGYATWNPGPHLCVEVPDGCSTITCRTSQGRKVTFSFLPYEQGGPPQCVDIHEATAPAIHFDDKPSHIQRLIAFGKGPTIFRSKPTATERKDAVTLTTLIISPP